MDKYLYGASIQGIQSFIFQTNKLREIVGGSELVEEICTEMFYDFIGSDEHDENIILSAAGNIKYISNEETCKRLVKEFPKLVMEKAPGVTVSQAVIKINEKIPLSDLINQLEEKLKSERNKPNMPLEIGFMGLERARRTGGVAIEFKKNRKGNIEAICESTFKKIKILEEKPDFDNYSSHTKLFKKISGLTERIREITLETEDLCKGHSNSWIAVVHADGNGLGKILRVMGEKLKNEGFEKSKTAFREFSLALDKATQAAAQSAFWKVFSTADAFTVENKYPIRPIICGGDDLTFIIRADLALPFTEIFLKEFELTTEKEFKVLEKYGIVDFMKGITACAGIAYIKESYPLHYALNLSEKLCKNAKNLVKKSYKRANGIPESGLAFYKVQESFIEDLPLLIERTLQATQGDKKLNYYFGPYLLDDLISLKERLELLKDEANSQEGSKAIGKIRKIISDTHKDYAVALFNLERMKSINGDFFRKLKLQEDLDTISRLADTGLKSNLEKSQLMDLITLHGFKYGTRQN